jgi:opacity protein-like surface antigen
MLRALACAVLSVILPVAAQAVELEVSARYGKAFPFYEQSFAYDPGSVVLDVPGFPNINLQQKGSFRLDAKGGSAYGFGVTAYLVPSVGIEARIDSAGVDIVPTSGRYNVSVDLPAPLPDVTADLDMGTGVVQVKRLQPYSINLKIKTPGRVGLALSGGVSYLPEPSLVARQRIGLGATAFDAIRSELTVGSLVFRASATPSDDSFTKRFGGNIGGGLRVEVAGPLSLGVEGRYFVFPKHRLDWTPELEGPLSVLDSALLAGVKSRLQPIEFYPAFWQITGGLSLTF